jgi:Uma2 family endonuclease
LRNKTQHRYKVDSVGNQNPTYRDKTMLLELKKIEIPQGQKINLRDISWGEFEEILQDLGDKRNSKIAYDHGILEIMTPLPEHESNKEIIGDLIKALLEELDLEFCSLGSTTFKKQEILQGIEPDNCFYIENEAKIRGKKRIDLTIDPPPDLALEIDLTSRTHPNIYQALGVTELWRFENEKLQIYVLEKGQYLPSQKSSHFPTFPITKLIPEYVKKVNTIGRNKTMKEFRALIREYLQ